MDPSTFRPDADEVQTLAEVIREEFGVDGEPLSEREAQRAATIMMDKLHGAGYDVVELYGGEPWTTEAVSDSDD